MRSCLTINPRPGDVYWALVICEHRGKSSNAKIRPVVVIEAEDGLCVRAVALTSQCVTRKGEARTCLHDTSTWLLPTTSYVFSGKAIMSIRRADFYDYIGRVSATDAELLVGCCGLEYGWEQR